MWKHDHFKIRCFGFKKGMRQPQVWCPNGLEPKCYCWLHLPEGRGSPVHSQVYRPFWLGCTAVTSGDSAIILSAFHLAGWLDTMSFSFLQCPDLELLVELRWRDPMLHCKIIRTSWNEKGEGSKTYFLIGRQVAMAPLKGLFELIFERQFKSWLLSFGLAPC